jgi:hypothetical protein
MRFPPEKSWNPENFCKKIFKIYQDKEIKTTIQEFDHQLFNYEKNILNFIKEQYISIRNTSI